MSYFDSLKKRIEASKYIFVYSYYYDLKVLLYDQEPNCHIHQNTEDILLFSKCYPIGITFGLSINECLEIENALLNSNYLFGEGAGLLKSLLHSKLKQPYDDFCI